MKNNDVLFVGGFCGTGKTSGKDFYALNFAVKPKTENANRFGFDNATIFVTEKDYKRFITIQPMSYVDAQIVYARGGYILLSYNI